MDNPLKNGLLLILNLGPKIMELNLTYKLILIALDDENGKFITDTAHLHYGIAGSILLELALQKRIALKDEKADLISTEETTSPCLNHAIGLINESKKPRSIQHWINTIGLGAEQVKDTTIDHLTRENVLRKDAGKILWIIPTTKFPTEDPYLENQVREKLMGIVMDNDPAEVEDLMMLSLIEESDLMHEVFRSKEEYKKANKRIEDLKEDIENAKESDIVIQAVHEAVTKAIMVAIINSSTVTTTSD